MKLFFKIGPAADILGIAGAVIHSVTWLIVMPKILPLKLTKKGETITFIVLIVMACGINTLLYTLITGTIPT
ncbi:MAG TPA: hypothetical protein VI588_04840 [Candidatus Gracilibacteria bacterium]|nr:hypothetical protein [Candidatus Gracilibacteria bacterium]